MKECTKCKIKKEETEYYIYEKVSKTGYKYKYKLRRCKACIIKISLEHREKNLETKMQYSREYNKSWRQKPESKEKIKASSLRFKNKIKKQAADIRRANRNIESSDYNF